MAEVALGYISLSQHLVSSVGVSLSALYAFVYRRRSVILRGDTVGKQ